MPIRYHLVDSLFPRRALAYLITGVILGIPFLGLAWLIGQLVVLSDNIWILVALVAVLAGASWPVFYLTLGFIDRLLYSERYDYFQALDDFINRTQSIHDPRHVDQRVAALICGAMNCRRVYLLVPDLDGESFIVSVCHPDEPCADLRLNRADGLVSWLERHRKTLLVNEIKAAVTADGANSLVAESLAQAGVDMIVPVALKQGQLAALLLVGKRFKGQYSENDRMALLVMAGHLAVTLENTRLYRESLAIRHSLERWLDSMVDAVIIAKRDRTISFINRAARLHLGVEVGEACYSVHGRTEPCEDCPMAGLNGRTRVPMSVAEIDGRFYEIASAPLLEADGAYGLIKVLRDVTERQTAERRLQQSEQLFRTLAELLPSMVFVLREGDIVYANQRFFDAATHLTFNQDGEKADDVIDLFVPACRPAVAQDLARRLAGENISSRECRISDASGREIPVILSLEAFEDDGRVTVIGVLSDISVQKQAETERRKMEARMALAAHQASIGVMASGIAHEINNPLTGVIGFSQLLAQRPDLPEDIRDDAAIIDSGAQRVAGIIRRLLTFADPRPPRQEPADLNNLVSETLKSMAAELEHHGIELILELSPELPQVITDASQIQQAFLNIIKNAVTELHKLEGAKRLTVTTEVRGRMTAVTFADNGPGIPPDNLPRIFDPFFTTREVGQGTGLGLSVCHGIITRNSGCITAANRPEGGAVFTVELPQTVG